MNINRVRYIPLVLLPVLLLISACSPSLGTGNSSLTVLQVLQNSTKAMKDLKSAHIETKTAGTLQTLGTPGTPTPTTASSLMFNVSGSGDEALPNEEQLQVTVSQGKNSSRAIPFLASTGLMQMLYWACCRIPRLRNTAMNC